MKTLSAVVAFLVLVVGVSVSAQDGGPARPSLLKATFGKLPIYFVENRGVYSDEVAYYVQGADKTLFFTKAGITFRLKGRDRDWVVKLEFAGANPKVQPEGQGKQQAVFSYFQGPPKDWKTGLRTFSRIVYRELWPGIDLVYSAGVGTLKYAFVVKPGADPGRIQLRYRGASSLTATSSGALEVETPEGRFEDAPPVAYQEIDGKRVPVAMGYVLGEGGEFGFDLGDYDPTHPLVLDPAVLVYCGYIGGAEGEFGLGVAVDRSGHAYVTGFTKSDQQTFPASLGPLGTHNGGCDAFVAKVDSRGTGLDYCCYIGGTGDDYGNAIAVDGTGHVYLTGYTRSKEQTFPVTVGPDLTFNGGDSDAYVAKVNVQGTGLVYCGYLGGADKEYGNAIAVDGAGHAYVTGYTSSDQQTFPVVVGPQLTFGGGSMLKCDAFVAKVRPDGAALVFCGYIGGTNDDHGESIALDSAGQAYVTGNTNSDHKTFPVRVGPGLVYNGGTYDAFLAKVNAQGTTLVYCGYIGGKNFERGTGVAVDAAGNAYVAGYTDSDEQSLPVKVGPDLTYNGGSHDCFVAKVNAAGTDLIYCGYIGGASLEWGTGLAVDGSGSAYVTGYTQSDEQSFPVKAGPGLTHHGVGIDDAFVAKVDPTGTGLVYCGYIGGGKDDASYGIAVDMTGDAYVAGLARSAEQGFPVTVGPDLTINGGFYDAFVAKIALPDSITAYGANHPGGTVTLDLQAVSVTGLPFQLGSSLGTGPILIGPRQVNLSVDGLLMISVGGWWPSVFSGYRGVLDSKGRAQAAIHLPNIPALVGVWIHTAFVTVDAQAPSGIKSVSDTFSFPITK